MTLLALQSAGLAYGLTPLLDAASCTIQEGEAWLNIDGAEVRVVPQVMWSATG